MKKLVSILASMMILTSSIYAQEINLKINNEIIETEIKPVQESGTTLVPLRIVGEYLGAEIEWNQETQTVIITKDNQIIDLIIGSKVVKVNGVEQILQCAPKLIQGTTMVPIRLVSEHLGSTVVWEQETATVFIESKTTNVDSSQTTKTTTIPFIDGTYVGEFKVIESEEVPHGKGVFTTFDESVIKEGIYENGELMIGRVILSNGVVLEGDFRGENELYEGTITYFTLKYEVKMVLPVKDGITGDGNIYNLKGGWLDTITAERFYEFIAE